jgi:hypothetical protein
VRSNLDSLDLIEGDRVAGAVVKLGRARALMRRRRLRILERAAAFKIGRDAGRAEHVAAELLREPGVGGTPADHAIGIDAVYRGSGERITSAYRGPEEATPASSRMPAAAMYSSRVPVRPAETATVVSVLSY